MHVIASSTIKRFADTHKNAAAPLLSWLRIVEQAVWASITDVQLVFPHADAVRVGSGNIAIVFNIKGNAYRLITAIHFNRGKVYVLRLLTHAEYDKKINGRRSYEHQGASNQNL
jgi:mRNA interferase HigB